VGGEPVSLHHKIASMRREALESLQGIGDASRFRL